VYTYKYYRVYLSEYSKFFICPKNILNIYPFKLSMNYSHPTHCKINYTLFRIMLTLKFNLSTTYTFKSIQHFQPLLHNWIKTQLTNFQSSPVLYNMGKNIYYIYTSTICADIGYIPRWRHRNRLKGRRTKMENYIQ